MDRPCNVIGKELALVKFNSILLFLNADRYLQFGEGVGVEKNGGEQRIKSSSLVSWQRVQHTVVLQDEIRMSPSKLCR
jgi:hypothetical protein